MCAEIPMLRRFLISMPGADANSLTLGLHCDTRANRSGFAALPFTGLGRRTGATLHARIDEHALARRVCLPHRDNLHAEIESVASNDRVVCRRTWRWAGRYPSDINARDGWLTTRGREE